MSPRTKTIGHGLLRWSTAVTEDSAWRLVFSDGSAASGSSTFPCVRGSSIPISGSRWMSCLSSAMSAAMVAASTSVDVMLGKLMGGGGGHGVQELRGAPRAELELGPDR